MRRLVLVGTVAVLIGLLVPLVSAGGATTAPSSYPLGSASSCKAGYAEKILTHKVKGKSQSYIACAKAPAVTTTTTAQRTVPNLVNVNLATAETKLNAEGIGYKVVGGGVFGVVITSDWTVCSQSPLPGQPIAKSVSSSSDPVNRRGARWAFFARHCS